MDLLRASARRPCRPCGRCCRARTAGVGEGEDLHRPFHQPDHRNVLVLHHADQHRRNSRRGLWSGGHRESAEPHLRLPGLADQVRPDTWLLGSSVCRRDHQCSGVPDFSRRHRRGPRARYAARRAGFEASHVVRHARRLHAGALVSQSAVELARDLRQLSVSRCGRVRPGLHDRVGSDLERRRHRADPRAGVPPLHEHHCDRRVRRGLHRGDDRLSDSSDEHGAADAPAISSRSPETCPLGSAACRRRRC